MQHALYTLISRPEYVDALRAEVKSCIDENGWTKHAVDDMKLLDGFIKESQRLNIIGISTSSFRRSQSPSECVSHTSHWEQNSDERFCLGGRLHPQRHHDRNQHVPHVGS